MSEGEVIYDTLMHGEGVFVCLLLGVCRARAIADRSRQADWNDGTVRVVRGGGVCKGGDRFATRAFRLCCYRLQVVLI